MVEPAGGQDEANPAFWLAKARLGFSALVPQLKVPFLGVIQPNKLGHWCICTDGRSADVLSSSF